MVATLDIQQHLDIDNIMDPARLAAKICRDWSQDGIILTSQGEGFDLASNGLYDVLDGICNETDYDKPKITIETWNLLESHPHYNIKRMPEIYETKWFYRPPSISMPNSGKMLVLMGRGTLARMHMHELLFNCDFRSNIIYTFHMDLTTTPWPCGMKQMMLQGKSYNSFEQTTPTTDLGQRFITPIIPPKNILKMQEIYDQAALEIVVETVTNQGFFVTEKTLRPMYYGRPFIPVAPLGYEDNLRKLGFSLDFGLPKHLENFGHLDKVQAVYDFLKTWKFDPSWFTSIRPVLEHNQRVLSALAMQKGKIDLSLFNL